MHLSITDNVTAEEKEELLTGLRAYNAQFLDLSTFGGDIGVYMRDDNGVMLGGLIGVRKGDWLNIDYLWVSAGFSFPSCCQPLMVASVV